MLYCHPAQEHELMVQALREDGLLYEPQGKADLPVVSDAELAKELSGPFTN